MKKFILIALGMMLFFSLLFIMADHFGFMEPQKIEGLFEGLHNSSGRLIVAAAVVVLLFVDLLLPVPSSVTMAFSGMFLGLWIGGAVSFLGAMTAACGGFWFCRWGGQGVFKRLVGKKDMVRIDSWFRQYGVYAIIISRPIPMLTEILSCLAGLSDLRFRTFLFSSILGTLPICFVYSYVGSRGSITDPWPAVWVAILIPAFGWLATKRIKGSV